MCLFVLGQVVAPTEERISTDRGREEEERDSPEEPPTASDITPERLLERMSPLVTSEMLETLESLLTASVPTEMELVRRAVHLCRVARK